MGLVRPVAPVKLFVGLLSSVPGVLEEAEGELARLFGPVDLRSDVYAFDSTRYYDEEMGTPIGRQFLSFANLIRPEEISGIKVATNQMEGRFTERVRTVPRPINLDPGYLELSKVVLASTKNFFHRILVSGGIYAEVTLHFQGGVWKSFPWTFPDYRNGTYDGFFDAMRRRYRAQLDGAQPQTPW